MFDILQSAVDVRMESKRWDENEQRKRRTGWEILMQ